MKHFDNIIIGSGQAGTPLAFKLAKEGQTVAFIEKSHYGGTCLNNGCTPTKAYVASARRIWEAKNGETLGIIIPIGARADLEKIKTRKDQLIQESVEGIKKGLESEENITLYWGQGVFSGPKEVTVNGEKLRAERVFINVGGSPRVPAEYTEVQPLTNESILQLCSLPEHLIIVGGGYIGLEFGQIFRRFGSKVTIVEKNSSIIQKEDPEIAESISDALKAEGVEFRLNATCMGAGQLADGRVSVNIDCEEGPPKIEGSHLLLAIGRVPNTAALNLGACGLETDKRGYIEVDHKLETAAKGIYALGDCNGHGGFTHASYHDFQVVADQLFGKKQRTLNDRILTYGLFVDPPLGRVGITLGEAKSSGLKVLVNDRPMTKVARAKEKGETRGMMRVIVDSEDGKILGAAVLGTGGDEVISGITNLMYAKASYKVLRDSVQIHPTVAELLPTLLEGLKPSE